MKTPVFCGSAVAIVTPFNGDALNRAKLAELCEFQIAGGTDAIVVAGTTGEASTMPDEEHLEAIRTVVDTVRGRLPVIAGTGSNDTRHAVELSRAACDLGVDALLCVTPYYNKTTQNGLVRHFETVADAVGKPMILYNVPSRTNLNINPETLEQLCRHPNINGVKECHIEQVPETMQRCGDDLLFYSGEDGMVLPMLALGGYGVISVVGNIVPRDVHDLCATWFDGDTAAARAIQIRLAPLIKAMFCEVNPMPVKTAMNLIGLDAGPCRLPLCDVTPASLALIRRALTQYGLLAEGEVRP